MKHHGLGGLEIKWGVGAGSASALGPKRQNENIRKRHPTFPSSDFLEVKRTKHTTVGTIKLKFLIVVQKSIITNFNRVRLVALWLH